MSALSAEVAEKVMEWKVNRSERGWHTVGVTPKRLIGPAKRRLPGDLWDPWDPYTDPRAMMEVVEKMRADGFRVSIGSLDAEWYVCFGAYAVAADTLGEAVCRAAIRAKEGE